MSSTKSSTNTIQQLNRDLGDKVLEEAKQNPQAYSARFVGIANGQTVVYPFDSPGGWSLIGRTDLVMFDPGRDPASLIGAGDRVRFVPR